MKFEPKMMRFRCSCATGSGITPVEINEIQHFPNSSVPPVIHSHIITCESILSTSNSDEVFRVACPDYSSNYSRYIGNLSASYSIDCLKVAVSGPSIGL